MTSIKDIRKIGTVTPMVGARIDPETRQWLYEYCARERITVSALVAKLITDFKKENG